MAQERQEVLALVEDLYDNPCPPCDRAAAMRVYGMCADMVFDQRMPYDPLRTDEPYPTHVKTWAETYLP